MIPKKGKYSKEIEDQEEKKKIVDDEEVMMKQCDKAMNMIFRNVWIMF